VTIDMNILCTTVLPQG